MSTRIFEIDGKMTKIIESKLNNPSFDKNMMSICQYIINFKVAL